MQQLRHFLAAVRFGNIARAAEETYISQSGLSRSIKSLETRLGVNLLIRGPHGVEPTAFGLALVDRAQIILNEVARAQTLIREINAGDVGEVTLGATHNYAFRVLPQVIAAFNARRPGVRINVTTSSFPDLVERLKLGQLDFALVLLGPLERGSELSVEELGESEARVVARAGHPLVESVRVSNAELAAARWAMLDSQSLQQKFEAFFDARQEATPRQVLKTNSIVLLKKLVLGMDALTVLPADMVEAELASGEFKVIQSETPADHSRAGLIFRGRLSIHANEVVNLIRANYREAQAL
ncbi:LysR family transcriptional regulator [Phenylobacterium aquaticum]|uniref:LysR family transcriptional regulator n=1 Tax=Phenylobacterium aquaticum TaxID=1763816 RepID=UPI0026F316F8|nr:LysR family transcriptional regulator [Phenylobacterium aquaticum]